MEYDHYGYLFPPRPEKAVPSGLINFYEKRGFVGQIKKNGTCTVIFTNGKDVIFKTRQQDADHKLWAPTPDIVRFFGGKRSAGNWNVYVAELLHSKVTGGTKNHLYIFDKIVHDGVQLVGSKFGQRHEILRKQLGGEEQWDRYTVHPNVSVAKNLANGLSFVYKRIAANGNEEDEGLVLKNLNGVLKPCFTASANDGWMVKVRLPKKNFGF